MYTPDLYNECENAKKGVDCMERFEEQLRAYYQTMQLSNYKDNPAFIRVRYRVYTAMDRFRRENPNASAVALKGELHRRIAEEFQPVLFDEIPFFYEMGVKPSDCWGYPIPGLPSCWNFFILIACASDGVAS